MGGRSSLELENLDGVEASPPSRKTEKAEVLTKQGRTPKPQRTGTSDQRTREPTELGLLAGREGVKHKCE